MNQTALSRYNKPGGYFVDQNPQSKVTTDVVNIPQDLFGSLHEYERMYDDLMGLPPIAQGKGEKGVRSAAHASHLVRQFSPRFKDRALLVERSVEALGGLMLDLERATNDQRLIAWCPEKEAGLEGVAPDPLTPAPAPGLVAVPFRFGDLPDNTTLTVDSHSSSPAFSAEAKALTFDLFKIGAMSAEDVIERSDVSDPEDLMAGVTRRGIAKQEAAKEAEIIKMASHGKK